MVRDGGVGPPGGMKSFESFPAGTSPSPLSSGCLLRLRTQQNPMPIPNASIARAAMTIPTIGPVPRACVLDLFTVCESEGGAVGVTVTVRTWPVTVVRDKDGVGVHAWEGEDEDEDELGVVLDVLTEDSELYGNSQHGTV
jgi:hypothetical protein